MSDALSPGKVAEHELRHIYAFSIAMVAVGTEKSYEDAFVHFDIREDHRSGEGEAACYVHPLGLAQKISYLGSIGPVAKADRKDIFRAFRNSNWDNLQFLGDLSGKDMQGISTWDGPETMLLRCAIGAKNLEELVGPSKFRKQINLMREVCRQKLNVDSNFRLKDMVPFKIAKRMHDKAKKDIEAAIAEGKTSENSVLYAAAGGPKI